jgi:hypothetical protein
MAPVVVGACFSLPAAGGRIPATKRVITVILRSRRISVGPKDLNLKGLTTCRDYTWVFAWSGAGFPFTYPMPFAPGLLCAQSLNARTDLMS